MKLLLLLKHLARYMLGVLVHLVQALVVVDLVVVIVLELLSLGGIFMLYQNHRIQIYIMLGFQ